MCKSSRLFRNIWVLFALQTSIAFAQPLSQLDIDSYLDNQIPDLISSYSLPGLALAVFGFGEDTIVRAYGLRQTSTRQPMTSSTILQAASISKTMFAVTVMKLVEKGVLDLDVPLAQYSKYETIAADSRSELITARMVLSHTSGLPNALPRGVQPSIGFQPGSRFSYSGWGFRYLQQVVETLTGKSLNLIMEEELWGPLDMNHSSYIWRDEFAFNVADGHRADQTLGREIRRLEREYAEGGVVTTIDDLAKFGEYVLAQITAGNELYLSMVEPQIDIRDYGEGKRMSWSLGWGVEETPAGASIWHTGAAGYFQAFMMLDLDSEKGFAILVNSENGQQIKPDLVTDLLGSNHLSTEYSPSALSR